VKDGNWVPLSKGFLKYLPKDRAYSKVEAAVSLQCDYDKGNPVTVTGYSELWRWSKGKVNRFLKAMDIQIMYPESTNRKRNQRGLIAIHKPDYKRIENGLIRLIDSKDIETKQDQWRIENGLKTDLKQVTTKDPNPNPINSRHLNAPKTCPHEQILALYHKILPELPRVRVWSDTREKHLNTRWNEKHESENGRTSNTVEFWKGFFLYIRESDFLMGRKTDFKADFDFIINKSKFARIIEGSYHK
jgi:hypothetical protein